MALRSGRSFNWFLLACIGLTQCTPDTFDAHRFTSLRFHIADESVTDWNGLRGANATVLITLDPECPFCQGYGPVIDSLSRTFSAEGVRFVGLYPTTFIAPDSALRFARESSFDFPQVLDADCSIASTLHARVTPECFVLDKQGELLYRGAIDNWAVRAGKHRVNATEHYLSDALHAALSEGDKRSEEVLAVGCIVECDEATMP